MNQSEKETILVKLKELTSLIQGVQCEEATLFDHVEDNPVPAPAETNAETVKPKVIRPRIKDGTLTASSIAYRLSKEFGKAITRESVIKVGKRIGAKPTYCAKQHISRYSASEVEHIMDIYRISNQLWSGQSSRQ